MPPSAEAGFDTKRSSHSKATEFHPLKATAERATTARNWLTVEFGEPDGDGWLRCSDVDATVIASWEACVADRHREWYGRDDPMTSSGYVLSWYADVAPTAGALSFLLDRRVPNLDRDALAFHRYAEVEYPDAIALLDSTFWCLPDDPAADHADATVVSDQQALAAILRAQVRRHADDFLATYRPGARLPRRNLLGAFFDSLDGGFWISDSAGVPQQDYVASARLALPGATEEFVDGTRFYSVVDDSGREHLTRRRVSCCYYFKVAEDGSACTTCPRTSDTERAKRLCEHADRAAAEASAGS
jgi:hypothetical protein